MAKILFLSNLSKKLFDGTADSNENRDDYFHFFKVLNQRLQERGHSITASPTYKDGFDIVLHEFYDPEAIINKDSLHYLLLMESPIVKPKDFDIKNHQHFKRVFTWSDDLCTLDPNRYIKNSYCFDLTRAVAAKPFVQRKFCINISGNKFSKHQNELYSKRLNLIKWFEKFHPGQLDLYGQDWDRVLITGRRIFRSLNRLPPIGRLLFKIKPRPSYAGRAKSKMDTLSNYKFSICFENAHGFNGYITEKIIDCLLAKTIPIYLGAQNIQDYIPSECFIDMRDFSSFEDLYSFLKTIDADKFDQYMKNIDQFLHSSKAAIFESNFFSKQFIDTIENDSPIH